MYKGIDAHNPILIGRNTQNLKNWPCRWPNRLLNFSWGASLTEWRMLKSDFNLQWIGIYPRGLSCRYYLSTKVGKNMNSQFVCWIVTYGYTKGITHPPLCWPTLLGGLQCWRSKVRGLGFLWGINYQPLLFSTGNNTIQHILKTLAKVNLDNNYTFRWEILHTHS